MINMLLISVALFSFVHFNSAHAQTEKEICLERKHSTIEEFVDTQIACNNQNMHEAMIDMTLLATDENDALLKINPDKEYIGVEVPGNKVRPTITEWRKLLREASPAWKSAPLRKIELIRIISFEATQKDTREKWQAVNCGKLNLEAYVTFDNKKEIKNLFPYICNVRGK